MQISYKNSPFLNEVKVREIIEAPKYLDQDQKMKNSDDSMDKLPSIT